MLYGDAVGFYERFRMLLSFSHPACRVRVIPSLKADDSIVRAGFRRLTHPVKGATYTPAELVVLLNDFDHAKQGVPIKRLTSALSLCFDNKVTCIMHHACVSGGALGVLALWGNNLLS